MLVSCEKSGVHDSAPGPQISVVMPDTIFFAEYFIIDASQSVSNNGEDLNLCVSLMNGGRVDLYVDGLVADSLIFDIPGSTTLYFWILVEEEGRGWQGAQEFHIPYVGVVMPGPNMGGH